MMLVMREHVYPFVLGFFVRKMLFSLALWVESQQADEMNACCSDSKFDHGDYTYR